MTDSSEPVYVIIGTTTDGQHYEDALSALSGQPASATVYGDQDLARRLATAEQLGVTLQVRRAPNDRSDLDR
jgi:hypothetical protein